MATNDLKRSVKLRVATDRADESLYGPVARGILPSIQLARNARGLPRRGNVFSVWRLCLTPNRLSCQERNASGCQYTLRPILVGGGSVPSAIQLSIVRFETESSSAAASFVTNF